MQKSEEVKSYAKSIRRQIKFHTQHLSCNSKVYAVKPKFHLLRYLAHTFWYEKSYVMCRACCTTSATRPSRRARLARYAT